MDKKIIVTDNLKFLKKQLFCTKRNISYLAIEEDRKSNLFRDYIFSLPNAYEIARKDIIEEKEFIKNYSSLIYELNIKNASRIWWAMNFTNKGSLITSLCKNTYDFVAIYKLIEIKSKDDIIVFLSDSGLARFIKKWSRLKGIPIAIKVTYKLNLKTILSRVPAFFICYNFLKLALRMLFSKMIFKPVPLFSKKDCVIITQFENASFKKEGGFHDIYFGRLGEFLKRENRTFITCGFAACRFTNILKKRKYCRNNEIYPLEYFLSLADFLKCLKESIAKYWRRHSFRGNANIYGENVLWLINDEINKAFDTGQIFVNLSVYYSVKGLLKRIYANKLIYPFENRAWEKMILLAAREIQKDTKLTSYQHASLTPKHINFVLEKGEMARIPFPDEIISMGRITKNLLEDVFHFPKDFVKSGCALRQDEIFSENNDYKNEIKVFTILVALASSLEEYVRMLRFLDKASLNNKYTVKIRPHPVIDFEGVLSIYKPHNFNYTLDRNRKIRDSLNESKVVLYASSTVGVEALCMGKPVIYIDFGNFINSDPLFNFTEFKWRCENPKDFLEILNEINSLEESAFKEKQKKGILYAKDYFYPVDNENIKPFLEI